jgi:phosphoribosyl 1,2-cyclic phosphodiesterase
MLSVTFLGSGSRGNATLVCCGETTLLLDCGFSARETARRMAEIGADADEVTALLVTHEHSDHVSGVPVFARRHRVPVFATARTARAAGLHDERGCELHSLSIGDESLIGEVRVRAFRTSHDAADPVGFVFTAPDGTRIGIATDLGVFTAEVAEALSGCAVIGIETNHDHAMLESGPYPAFLKRRIASQLGHLSNHDACSALESLAHDGLTHVAGLHVSQENNTPGLAKRSLSARAASIGLTCEITVVAQNRPTPVPAT